MTKPLAQKKMLNIFTAGLFLVTYNMLDAPKDSLQMETLLLQTEAKGLM